ncbi:MAG: 7-carboxy-7-deazaguanine synthase QueE [Bacteroidetes bacterium HGW-Bacteroidetes-21]|nr:MAG: 7-carboxy-7-deazaguanine synthase QueE [Bacteroidetes bacterium HGW-Bacteroidetes-21]
MDLLSQGLLLPVVEHFYTLQGEGIQTGRAAWFIRLGGCDIGCNWCDARYTWNNDPSWLKSTDDLLADISDNPSKSVVVTGGEPLQYNLDYLCEKLHGNGVKTFIETSGSHNLSGNWDWICLSPKKQSPPLPGILKLAHELKVIIEKKDDFHWAEEMASKVHADCHLMLQPEWSSYETMIHEITDYIKRYPKWRISLQSHKFMNIP